MRKIISLIILTICVLGLSGCNSKNVEDIKVDSSQVEDIQTIDKTSTISGSFTVSVRDVIPDYCFDDITPNVAIVTEFQSYPFTLFVGEEIGSQLKVGEAYVFTIE